MRRALLVVLLALGCASGSMLRKLSIDVSEGSGQRNQLIGPHAYAVHLRNISQAPIAIESIRVDLPGTSDLDMEGEMESIGETITPGEDRSYQMSVTIMPRRGMGGMGQMPDLSNLRVTISCSDEGGSFVVDDTVFIGQRGY